MSKVVIGKTYVVKVAPKNMRNSGCPGSRSGDEPGKTSIKITRLSTCGGLMSGQLSSVSDQLSSQGFRIGGTYNVYENELVLTPYNKEAIEDEISEINKKKAELDKEVEELNTKVEWLSAVGVDVFDENEFKVYQTLSLLEDESVSKITKMKEIAKLIK